MKQMMDAIVKPAAGPGLELRQVPVPVPGPGEVLIKIHKIPFRVLLELGA